MSNSVHRELWLMTRITEHGKPANDEQLEFVKERLQHTMEHALERAHFWAEDLEELSNEWLDLAQLAEDRLQKITEGSWSWEAPSTLNLETE